MRSVQQMVRAFMRNPRIFIPALAVLVLLIVLVPLFASGLLTAGRHTSMPVTGYGSSSALVSATSTTSGGHSTTQPGQVTVGPTGGRGATPGSQTAPAPLPAGSTPIAGSSGTPIAGSGQTPTASPTVPSAPSPDDAAVVSIPSGLKYDAHSVYQPVVVMQNTGTASWAPIEYSLECKTNCFNSSANYGYAAPGTQISFILTLYTQPSNFWRTVVTSDWTMEHNGVPFGPIIPITYTLRGWYSILQQATPGCNTTS